MKKVMTFLFAFAMLSVVAFGQSREELQEKANSLVEEINKNVTLTSTQQDQTAEVLTDALVDIASKRKDGVNDREGYMAFRNERMQKALASMEEFLSDEQVGAIQNYAAERGLISNDSSDK